MWRRETRRRTLFASVGRICWTRYAYPITLSCLRLPSTPCLDQAATAETDGWREMFEREAKAVLYELQHLIHENGELEILQTEGVCGALLMCCAVLCVYPLFVDAFAHQCVGTYFQSHTLSVQSRRSSPKRRLKMRSGLMRRKNVSVTSLVPYLSARHLSRHCATSTSRQSYGKSRTTPCSWMYGIRCSAHLNTYVVSCSVSV